MIEDLSLFPAKEFAEALIRIQKDEKMYYLLGKALDLHPDMFWLKDAQHRFIFVSKALMRTLLLCEDREAVIGKTSVEIDLEIRARGIEYLTGDVCLQSDEITRERGKPCHFREEFRIQGKPLYLSVWKTPFFENGEFAGTIGSGRDVTTTVLEHNEMQRLCKEKNCEAFKRVFNVHKGHYLFDGNIETKLIEVERDGRKRNKTE